MRAAIVKKYGSADNFQIVDLPDPTMKDDEVLIKIIAASVNPIDWKLRKGMLRWLLPLKFPVIFGFDLSGEVIKCGSKISKLKVGDQIFGRSNKKSGETYAELITLKEKFIITNPKIFSSIESATIPCAATTALQSLRDLGQCKQHNKVLIIGASGGVGIFAVQIAKALGAHVTAVCSTKNIEFVKLLGADEVIDYKHQPVFIEGVKYQIIFDVVDAKRYSIAKNYLANKGIYITTVPHLSFLCDWFLNLFRYKKNKTVILKHSQSDLIYLKKLIEDGKLVTHIDKTYFLDEIHLAHKHSESERTIGKIAVKIGLINGAKR